MTTARKSLELLATSALCVIGAWTAGGVAPALAEEGVGEVVVTATRRAEILKEVPIAITAITAQEIEDQRIYDYKDAVARVPGASFIPIKGSTYASPQIRGQYTTNESPALDSPVAVFHDDLYYGSTASFNSDFYDISQVAVLKGPQGTTFGRNVVGGALQVTSQLPQVGENNGELTVGAGNYELLQTSGFINRTLTDDIAGRFSFSMRKRDGYIDNKFTGAKLDDENIVSGRAQLRYQPSDTLSALFAVSHTYQDNVGDGDRLVGPSTVGAVALQNTYAPDAHDVYLDDNGENKRQLNAALARIDWDTGLGTVSSITGFHSLRALYDSDVDVSSVLLYGGGNGKASNFNGERLYSQEFRLVSPSGGMFEYVVGLYGEMQHVYKKIDLTFHGPTVSGNGDCDPVTNPDGNWFFTCAVADAFSTADAPAFTSQVVDVHSLAPYAELRWNITDQLSATVGGRYTYISKEGVTTHGDGPSPFYGAQFVAKFDDSWTKFTPRVIVNWKPMDDLMFYVSRSEGFKSGGFSATMGNQAQSEQPLAPEESISYEAGFKGYMLDRKISLDLAVYKANTTDLQVKTLVGGVFQETNAGESEAKGVEVDLQLRPVDGLTLGARYAYTDATYKEFLNCTSGGVDCSGQKMPWTPENDLLVSAEYRWPAFNGELTASASAKFADEVVTTAVNSDVRYGKPLTKQDGIINGFLSYEPDQAPWRLQFWGKNLTDEEYAVYAANYYFMVMTNEEVFAPSVTCPTCLGIPRDIARVHYAPPRTFGVTFSYRFE